MANALRIVGISGSIREGSYNSALLRAAMGLSPATMLVEVMSIADLPLYNEDLDADSPPDAVRRLREEVRSADGLLVATPEYNYGVPGPLKNALDWASRPARQSAIYRKPCGIMGATPGVGGTIRAQLALRPLFQFNDMPCMLQPEVTVPRAHEKFDEQGNLTDIATGEFLSKFLIALETWVRRFKK